MDKYNLYDKFEVFQDPNSLAVKLHKPHKRMYEEYQNRKSTEEIGKEIAAAIQKELSKTFTIK